MLSKDKSDRVPKKVGKFIDEVVSALDVVKRLATDADYAMSDGTLTYKDAVQSTERLVSLAKCLDEDSITCVKQIAPTWSLVARLMSERDELTRRVKLKVAQDGKEGEERRALETGSEALISREYREYLEKALTMIRDGLVVR